MGMRTTAYPTFDFFLVVGGGGGGGGGGQQRGIAAMNTKTDTPNNPVPSDWGCIRSTRNF